MARSKQTALLVAVTTAASWPLAISGGQQNDGERAPATLQVELVGQKPGNQGEARKGALDLSNVMVWLVPLDAPVPAAARRDAQKVPQLVQRNKSFEPHALVVETGSLIAFPNKDPFLHNVFSLYDGKRFDLGFYEAGTAKTVRFDRPGPSFLFCNIHPDMSAVVMAVETPYYGISDRQGRVTLANVPDGRYKVHVWYERSSPKDLVALERNVELSADSRSLGNLKVILNANWSLAHKNKYGQDYVPPPATGYPDH